MPEDTLLQRRHRVLGSASPLFYDKPLHLVCGEGVWLFDVDGRRYLDVCLLYTSPSPRDS